MMPDRAPQGSSRPALPLHNPADASLPDQATPGLRRMSMSHGENMAYDKNMKVLVVDDFPTMRRIVKNILRQLGINNISEAEDGVKASALLEIDRFDLIISDWNMPNMTGIELLRHVRGTERIKDIPFLMVTAEAQQENIIEAVKAKVSNYIVKPFTADTLNEKMEKIFS
jgi:two-component system chemotaxis response regulator CheY